MLSTELPEEAAIRISELSRATAVPVPTIKYYLREGLLPPGERTAVNQARYDETHARRLRLIRVLREVADLPIATIRAVLTALEDEARPLHEVLGVAHAALGPPPPAEDGLADARREVDAFLDRLGWEVSAGAPARTSLARAWASLHHLGREEGVEAFAVYAEAADRLAGWELERVAELDGRERRVEEVVAGTVIYETVLTALRRLAQEHHSAQRFGRRHAEDEAAPPTDAGPGE